MRPVDRLGDTTGGDRIGSGIVRIIQADSIERARDLEGAFALSILVNGLVDDEGINDRAGVEQGSNAVRINAEARRCRPETRDRGRDACTPESFRPVRDTR